MDRIEDLLAMMNDDPEDPFIPYALALEYVRTENREKAGETFNLLLNRFPDYLPAYYQAARFFIEDEDHDLVRNVYEKGIELAEKQGQRKTLLELRSAYEQFLFEIDDF